MAVFVLDNRRRTLEPRTNKRSRLLQDLGGARAHRQVPSATRLVVLQLACSALQPLHPKLCPGTEFAQIRETKVTSIELGEKQGSTILLLLKELMHRGRQISENLKAGGHMRRRRRGNLLYRAPHTFCCGDKMTRLLTPTTGTASISGLRCEP